MKFIIVFCVILAIAYCNADDDLSKKTDKRGLIGLGYGHGGFGYGGYNGGYHNDFAYPSYGGAHFGHDFGHGGYHAAAAYPIAYAAHSYPIAHGYIGGHGSYYH